jgi:hypothetical protein
MQSGWISSSNSSISSKLRSATSSAFEANVPGVPRTAVFVSDIEASDVFVPKHRTAPLPLPDPVLDGALFRFRVVGSWSVGLAAAALGIARAAIDELLRLAEPRPISGGRR